MVFDLLLWRWHITDIIVSNKVHILQMSVPLLDFRDHLSLIISIGFSSRRINYYQVQVLDPHSHFNVDRWQTTRYVTSNIH